MYALLVLCCLLTRVTIHSQTDTSRGNVGSWSCFQRTFTLPNRCSPQWKVHLSNPTVWYPMHARIGYDTLHMQRASDSLWIVQATNSISGIVELEVCGIVLAGSDSVCMITMVAESSCAVQPDAIEQLLIITSVGPPLPYLRIARVEGPLPMPVTRGETFTIVIILDQPSISHLQLYDLLGRMAKEWTVTHGRGVHRLELSLSSGMSPGFYVLRFESSSGVVIVPVVVE
jgi:hypothetical protein